MVLDLMQFLKNVKDIPSPLLCPYLVTIDVNWQYWLIHVILVSQFYAQVPLQFL